MNEPHDPNETVTAPSAPADSLDAGLAAGFGRRVEGPASILSALGSTLGSRAAGAAQGSAGRERARREAGVRRDAVEGQRPATATSSPARSPAAAWARCCAAATSTWVATWRSRCCWRSTWIAPKWPGGSSKRRRSAGSCSIRAWCRSTTSAASATGRSSP